MPGLVRHAPEDEELKERGEQHGNRQELQHSPEHIAIGIDTRVHVDQGHDARCDTEEHDDDEAETSLATSAAVEGVEYSMASLLAFAVGVVDAVSELLAKLIVNGAHDLMLSSTCDSVAGSASASTHYLQTAPCVGMVAAERETRNPASPKTAGPSSATVGSTPSRRLVQCFQTRWH